MKIKMHFCVANKICWKCLLVCAAHWTQSCKFDVVIFIVKIVFHCDLSFCFVDLNRKSIQLSIFLRWVFQSWQSSRWIHLRLITISQVESKQTPQKKRKQNLTLCLSLFFAVFLVLCPSLFLSLSLFLCQAVVKMFAFQNMQHRWLWMMC